MSGNTKTQPEVGMAATILCWTDREAGTVTAWDGKILTVQEDKATLTSDTVFSESQTYDYERNPNGRIYHFKKNRKGVWKETVKSEKGRWILSDGGNGLLLGSRRKYHDPTF